VIALAVFLLVLASYQRRLIRQTLASRHQALHDPLTGLPNRELFADRIEQAIRTADRELRPAALLLLDLDRFKDVNDTLGHHHGDVLLSQVGIRLTAELREVDTVARLGGDEFAVLLPDATGEGAASVAEKLRAALHAPLVLDGVALDLDASIGIAVYPEHGSDAAQLLQHADVAMYAAKHAHAGFMVYDPTVDQHSPRRLALLGRLRRALEGDELVLHYQPKADRSDPSADPLGPGRRPAPGCRVAPLRPSPVDRGESLDPLPARPEPPRPGGRAAGRMAAAGRLVDAGGDRERRHGGPGPRPRRARPTKRHRGRTWSSSVPPSTSATTLASALSPKGSRPRRRGST
jgi:diguanylate cyclase (GGDEF)-like protein